MLSNNTYLVLLLKHQYDPKIQTTSKKVCSKNKIAVLPKCTVSRETDPGEVDCHEVVMAVSSFGRVPKRSVLLICLCMVLLANFFYFGIRYDPIES